MNKNISVTIVPRESQLKQSQKAQSVKQLNLWDSQQKPEKEASPYLQIKSVPVAERINPKEIRYALWIYPQGIRACGGQFTADEAHEISKSTRGWDWSLGDDGRPNCQGRLEQLVDGICKRSSVKNGGKR